MRFDVIAERFDLQAREVFVDRFDFLQTDDVRIRFLQPCQQAVDPRLDAIDVPGGNLHGSKRPSMSVNPLGPLLVAAPDSFDKSDACGLFAGTDAIHQ
ncbi:hypothetical protein D3C87_1944050 [compost metagenome]